MKNTMTTNNDEEEEEEEEKGKGATVADRSHVLEPGTGREMKTGKGKLGLDTEVGNENNKVLSAKEKELLDKAARLAVPKGKEVESKKRTWSQTHGGDPLTDHLRTMHRRKLRADLAALLSEHKWRLAAGVVGVLLAAPTGVDDMEHRAVADYWAAMEVVRRGEDGEADEEVFSSIKKLFKMLLRRQMPPKLRAAVQLEFAMYLMRQKDYDGCYNELRGLVGIPPYRDDPLMNFWYGLNLHHLWYAKVSEDVKKFETLETRHVSENGVSSSTEGVGETAGFGGHQQMMDRFQQEPAAQMYDAAGVAIADSNPLHNGMEDVKSPGWPAYGSLPRLAGDDEGEGDEIKKHGPWSSGPVRWRPDLDRRLFPVCLPEREGNPYYLIPLDNSAIREAHAGALKHLQLAIDLDPSMTEVLIPLTQLLLAVGNVDEAMHVIDNCCIAARNHILPISLKVLLLEELTPRDNLVLARCHREVLKINPSSVPSLEALMMLHKCGFFDTLSIMEAIATHLDVESGSVSIWDKLAGCFKAVRNYVLQDGESNQTLKNADAPSQDVKVEPQDTHKLRASKAQERANILKHVQVIWTDRRTWWGRKHFRSNCALGDCKHGSFELILWKAVCSAHVLGSGGEYEQHVIKALERANRSLLLRMLQKHVRITVFSLLTQNGLRV